MSKNEEWAAKFSTPETWATQNIQSDPSALHAAKMPDQGPEQRVLCVCSAGLLRSPTIAAVLALPPFSFNTRAAGLGLWALIPVTQVLLFWADTIIVADNSLLFPINQMIVNCGLGKKDVFSLSIPDNFNRMDPTLVGIIEERVKELELI